jgi:hypothetical protein
MTRDFRTISPSALSVILMKGHTALPYAREVAQLLSSPETFEPEVSHQDFLFWSKVFHFESRYLGINQLLEGVEVNSFLELSSGFNLRCLEISGKTGKVYFDTDLPDLIEQKVQVVEALRGTGDPSLVRLMPLNALDRGQFEQTVSEMPPGPVAIINEGLLVYFDKREKETLCAIIRDTLAARGGYWITSDIYVRAPAMASPITQDQATKSFSERHHIDENKFSSFEEARQFFETNGFAIDGEGRIDHSRVSSFEHLARTSPKPLAAGGRSSERFQRTWRLRVAT